MSGDGPTLNDESYAAAKKGNRQTHGHGHTHSHGGGPEAGSASKIPDSVG